MDLRSVVLEMALAEPAIVWPVKEDACHKTTDPWSIVINVNDHLRNGPGISSQPGTNWSGNSVGTVWVAGIPGYSETTQTDGSWTVHNHLLIPGLLAGLFLLSPGAPVNNCRWASIQWTWDQVYCLRDLIDLRSVINAWIQAAAHWYHMWSTYQPWLSGWAASFKLQASSLTSGTIPDTKNLERINYENRKK